MVADAANGVWEQLEAAARHEVAHSGEMPVATDHGALAFRYEREPALFIVARDLADELNAPRLLVDVAKAKLAEWNAELRHPTAGVACRSGLPDRVPRLVFVRLGTHLLVTPNATRIDAEAVRGEVVVVAVQRHEEPIRTGQLAIAPSQPTAHGARRI